MIVQFVQQTNKLPTSKILQLELRKQSAPEELLNSANQLIGEISAKSDIDTEYLIKESEKWCRDRAVYNAIMDSIQIIDGQDSAKTEGAIPEILSDALGVSFDQAIGHDYIDNSEERFEFYNTKEHRIPFDLDYFNKITKGGLPNKTLNIALVLLVLALVNLYLCVTVLLLFCNKVKMFYILLWKWQKKELQNVLMLI